MLNHSQPCFITHSVNPTAFHLGDLINIVQQYHLESLNNNKYYYIGGNTTCACCQVNTGDTIKFILGLLDTRIKFVRKVPSPIYATPMWFKKHEKHPCDYKPYAKAKSLPLKKKHVVCQFDGRSKGNKRPNDEEIDKIIKQFPKIINIGDRNLPCENRTNLGLHEKFKLIAAAKFYIGIDSGLTHLALMTNTPVAVLHPVSWHVRKYYPKSKQIKFSTTAEELIQKINRLSQL